MIHLWDARTGAARGTVSDATLLDFVPGAGGALLVMDRSGQAREWDLLASRWRSAASPLSDWAGVGTAASFSPDGRTLAWGLDDGTLRTWNTEADEGRLIRVGDDDDRVLAVDYSPRGDRIMAVVDAGLEGRFLRPRRPPHPDHTLLVAPSTGEILRSSASEPPTSSLHVELSPDGDRFVQLPWAEPPIEVRETASGRLVRRIDASGGGIFGPDGHTMLVEAWPKRQSEVRLVDLDTGATIWSKPPAAGHLLGASLDRRRYLTEDDGTVREWDFLSGDARRQVRVPRKDAYLDPLPFAETVLMTEQHTTPALLALAGGEVTSLEDFHIAGVREGGQVAELGRPPVFSPDGHTLVAAISGGFHEQGYLTLYDLRDQRAVAVLRSVGDVDLAIVWAVKPATLGQTPGWSSYCEGGGGDDCYRATLADGRSVDHPTGVATSFAPSPEGPLDFIGSSARAYLTCRVGAVLLPFDVCEERVRAPGMFGQILRGDRSFLEP